MIIEFKVNKEMTDVSGILLIPSGARDRVAGKDLWVASWDPAFTCRLRGDMKRGRAIPHHKLRPRQ